MQKEEISEGLQNEPVHNEPLRNEEVRDEETRNEEERVGEAGNEEGRVGEAGNEEERDVEAGNEEERNVEAGNEEERDAETGNEEERDAETRNEEDRDKEIRNKKTRYEEQENKEKHKKIKKHAAAVQTKGGRGEGNQNKWNRLKGRVMSATGALLCFMLATGLLLDLLFDCMSTNTVGRVYWNNPFSMQRSASFEESPEYGRMLHYDLAQLSRHMAVCSQLETDGEFDENKTVDIVSYAYRKSPEIPDYLKNIKIEYRVGDLIEWANYGIGFHKADLSEKQRFIEGSNGETYVQEYGAEEAWEQYNYEKESLAAIEEDTIDEDAIAEETEITIATENPQPEDDEAGDAKESNDKYAGFDLRYILTERFAPVGEKSLYDIKLPENITYYEIACLVVDAANDLADNFEAYQEMQSKFEEGRNLKYVLRSSTGRIMKTNLKDASLFEKQLKEYNKCNSYLIYDYGNNTIESKNIGQLSEFSVKALFRDYAYQYPDGATVCVAIPGPDMDTAYWGEYNELDGYARARRAFQNVSGEGMKRTIAIVVVFLLAFSFLVIFSTLQPRGKAQQLRGFDRMFTEIAAGLAVASEGLLLALGVVPADAFLYDSSFAQAGFLHTKEFFALLMLIAFVMYVLFLLFWGSFIRRCKAHTLWSQSLICTIFRKVKHILWKIFEIIFNEKSFIVRVAVPYMIYVLFCVFLVLAGEGAGAVLVILLNAAMLCFLFYQNQCRKNILDGITRICEGDIAYQIPTEKLVGDNKILAQNINAIGNTIEQAVKTSLKDEKLKADLITNVSHDIKTPLTSIINYVDLLKKENIPGEKAQEYIRILDEKSQRLKHLILDLVEASKISSGNIDIEKTKLNMTELMQQAIGEYEEKLKTKNLTVITELKGEKGDMFILADSRHMWRVFDNLFGNIYKYAMAGTRVYLELETDDRRQNLILQIKNISEKPLHVPVEDLTRRFVRGDEARNSEGSGLGLSIAKTLTQALGGTFRICLDGDLFKVTICFPRYEDSKGQTGL